ncbi:hypothetical protein ASG88_11475 [Nocardioides sp. Soil777]|uniref:hypothetical protein n=1 Tax=Nocardioides sp. Soil777 TaxID=1736409 RepID=UPI0007026530|nr:hypothetical protein [Nocardioides sp. Soil777]KRF00018.1 hypothetical protein ASG88_11475 [Nocardioides sp. Soil777]
MRRLGLVAWACTGALVALGACSSDDGTPGDRTPDAGASTPAGEPTADSAAADVATTEPGTVLALGDAATVVWRSSADLEGVLELRVDAVREAATADFDGLVASGTVAGAQPYYVDVTVANVGDTDLGGLDVPLYLLDTSDTLGPPWGFEEPFASCRSRPLPRAFTPGDSRSKCLVFFARAGSTYDAMAFQPTPDVEAITWTGEPEPADRERPSRRRP